MGSGQHGHEHSHSHSHSHDDSHSHGHEHDQGLSGALRYLRFAPEMWRSAINNAVIDRINPQPGEFAVDVGAGMGPGAVRAAGAGVTVTALEPTPFLRAVLNLRRLVSGHRSQIDVVAGSAEHTSIEAGAVDALWSVNTMHHWVDGAAGVAEIVRILKPSGRLLLVDEDFNNPEHPDFQKFADHHEDMGKHGFTLIDAADMERMFKEHGLSDVEASETVLDGRPVIMVSRNLASS